jgi:hypothetical protein
VWGDIARSGPSMQQLLHGLGRANQDDIDMGGQGY